MANFKFNPLLTTITPSWRAFHAVYHTPLVFEDPSFYTQDDLNNVEDSNRPLQNILKNVVTLKEACEALSSTDIVSSINTWTKAQRPVVVTAKGAAGNLTLDLDEANTFTHSLIEDVTLAAPLHSTPGQGGNLWFTQSSGTPYEVLVDSFWKFPGGLTGPISLELSETKKIEYLIEASGNFAICFIPIIQGVVCTEEQILYPFAYYRGSCDPGSWQSDGTFGIGGYSLTLYSKYLLWRAGIDTFRMQLYFPTVPTPRMLTVNGVDLLITAPGNYEISGPVPSLDFSISYQNLDSVLWYITGLFVNNCSGSTLLEYFSKRDLASEVCEGIHTQWAPANSQVQGNDTFWRTTAPVGWEATPNLAGGNSYVTLRTVNPLISTSGDIEIVVKFTSLNGYNDPVAGPFDEGEGFLVNLRNLEFSTFSNAIWTNQNPYSPGEYEVSFTVNSALINGFIQVKVEYPPEDIIVVTCIQFIELGR